ncbi:MAG: dinitrogenase iron-molybdenum cofactor biosynthesis protein [Melioribacteraceae bacterium]|nr:dinitrogenase iron-molybdenum cofactor biosynthesis protein [Melioribacteraceae bacterium]MCF8354602.1 dinitrogenase iron-molybdenum cofactor biosynthesis protein [Melioribacteraceae bacterium]MCF8394954.1 dinitrogenase iron-molybdenum cofactor biosynthesis protein [Melioribacteraceae bacterium]MCF8420179.1 dinitrogenase iron-molybdenum cofactor biosynthesis protein [Melioribacteraceae bacterium]
MKIVIGSDGNTLESKVSKRFGHANYYLIYDTVCNELEIRKNDDDNHTHKILYELLDYGTDVFITGNIGPHAFEIINTKQTKICLARSMTAADAIESYNNNSLKQLTEPTVKKSIGHISDK